MIKPISNAILNKVFDYTYNLLNDPSIDLHTEIDVKPSLVLETESIVIYFTFMVDISNHTFIITTNYLNSDLEIIFTESNNSDSLTLAISDIIVTIKTLTNLLNYRK